MTQAACEALDKTSETRQKYRENIPDIHNEAYRRKWDAAT